MINYWFRDLSRQIRTRIINAFVIFVYNFILIRDFAIIGIKRINQATNGIFYL